jgi:hypothetical protein
MPLDVQEADLVALAQIVRGAAPDARARGLKFDVIVAYCGDPLRRSCLPKWWLAGGGRSNIAHHPVPIPSVADKPHLRVASWRRVRQLTKAAAFAAGAHRTIVGASQEPT